MLPRFIIVFIYVAAVKTVNGHDAIGSNDMDRYTSSYFDPKTGMALRGVMVNESYEDDYARDPTSTAKFVYRGLSCECQNLTCACCAGINMTIIKYKTRACTRLTFDPEDLSIKLDVMMNEREIYRNKVSARNPPPMCMPFPYFPIVNFCVRLFNVSLTGANLRTCVDFETRVVGSPVLVLHFNCAQMGADGFHWIKPGQETSGGKPSTNDESLVVYDEVEFEPADLETLADPQSLSPEELQVGQLKG